MDERTRDIVLGLTANPALPDHLRARLPARPTAPPRDTIWHVDTDIEQAADPATSLDDVTALLDHDNMAIRWTLAERPDLPLDAQQRLAADHIPGVRAGLAANPVVAEPIVRELANDVSADVRRGVAHNPSVPLDVLMLVVESTRIGPVLLPRVMAATDEELRLLVASPSPRARMLVAQRTALPSDVFELLVADDDIHVVKGIAPHPALSANRLRALAARHGPSLFRRLATNPNCDPELLHHMACHATARRVYRAVAEHPNTRAETLLLCLGDDTARQWAAEHPNLPTRALIDLVNDPDLARHAAANPALPIEVMESLIATYPGDLPES
ncbi:hypothetical protein DL991_27160 [Amycolatopsis sp. WAC 01375]|uniref:hypothetical protein n=1 Tax=unclassified Amycolatopsis TaxID=2618356 RepID=UPI000F78F999|nr:MULTISPECIES: hypothetical protein [unclassified Amycolatopsis]RSM75756.1 hypothetical protein DL991_27160 [Amycolatopsis sp. WAC 01375]RSN26223.1 hypothetical protein DL990_32930 [Amycolatopsis sp. WAC 01416]